MKRMGGIGDFFPGIKLRNASSCNTSRKARFYTVYAPAFANCSHILKQDWQYNQNYNFLERKHQDHQYHYPALSVVRKYMKLSL